MDRKFNGKNIAVWGAGESGQQMIRYLQSINIKVNEIIDNDYRKQNQYINGIKIVHPSKISSNFLIVCSEWEKEIFVQLEYMGKRVGEDYLSRREFIKELSKELYGEEPFNIWSPNNNLVSNLYKNNKVLTVNTNADSNRCIVLFSSNGLYLNNTQEDFIDSILISDRYEWKNLFLEPSLQQYYKKIILLRDLYKQWYVSGINDIFDTVDKVITLVKSLTRGYDVTTAGCSAGGYMASLVGCKMNAQRVINFSGQFSIFQEISTPSLIQKYSSDLDRNKYYDITKILNESKVPIFYFCPYGNLHDKNQYMKLKTNAPKSKVYEFLIDCDKHGIPISTDNLKKVFAFDNEKLIQLFHKIDSKVISDLEFTNLLR